MRRAGGTHKKPPAHLSFPKGVRDKLDSKPGYLNIVIFIWLSQNIS